VKARAGTDRARLRQLDLCLTLLEEARERGERAVSPDLAARVRGLVPGVVSGMPVARALDSVFEAQDDCQQPSEPVHGRRGAAPLDAAAARALTDEIKSAGSGSSPLLLDAQERRAWVALGYPSWERYVRVELGISRTRSYELLDHGRLIRAIETATGMSGAADITPYTARRVKPHLGELIAALKSRVAGRPADEVRTIVRDVVRSALPEAGGGRTASRRSAERGAPAPVVVEGERRLDPDLFWTVVRYLSSLPPASEAARQLAGDVRDRAHLERTSTWLADLAAELRAGARP
jgi:hypothetical protein